MDWENIIYIFREEEPLGFYQGTDSSLGTLLFLFLFYFKGFFN